MGRLTAMPPRLPAQTPRIGAAPGDERGRDRERAKLKPWRGWYNLARWSDLRREVLARDGYSCCQTGMPLIGPAGAPDSPIVDHIEEHKGDPKLFWDPDNLQSVSKVWHDSEKQRLERARD